MKLAKTGLAASFGYAFKGLFHAFRTQRNFRIHAVMFVTVITAAVLLKVPLTGIAVLTLTGALVMVLEIINTVVEEHLNLTCQKYNVKVAVIKDIMAGAVLTAAIGSVAVGTLVLGPPLLELLKRLWS